MDGYRLLQLLVFVGAFLAGVAVARDFVGASKREVSWASASGLGDAEGQWPSDEAPSPSAGHVRELGWHSGGTVIAVTVVGPAGDSSWKVIRYPGGAKKPTTWSDARSHPFDHVADSVIAEVVGSGRGPVGGLRSAP
jgi:hypothetical protein